MDNAEPGVGLIDVDTAWGGKEGSERDGAAPMLAREVEVEVAVDMAPEGASPGW